MRVAVQFFSYFKDLAGKDSIHLDLPEGSTVGALVREVHEQFPRLRGTERVALTAVGVEYQGPDYVLQEGDQVGLFPPVQGG